MRARLRLVWALGGRHLLTYRARLALSALGVASGVSLGIAVASLGSSIHSSLIQISDAAASLANLEVRPIASVGLPEQILDDVAVLRGVRATGTAVESFTQLRRGTRIERALLLGLDAGAAGLGPRSLHGDALTLIERLPIEQAARTVFGEGGVEGLFKEDADLPGLYLSTPVARDLRVRKGDTVHVATPSGWQVAEVGGVVETSARTAVTSIDVARDLLGADDRVDVVYVQVDEPRARLAEVQRAVGTRGRAGLAGFRDAEVRDLLGGATILIQLAGVVALFVGAFLVYNTMSMAAIERSTEAALMRAVGATRRQVLALHCATGGLLGVAGAGAGLLGGVLLSRRLLASRGSAIQGLYPISISKLVLRPRDLVVAGAVGVAAALIASFLPARRLSRADAALSLGPAGALEEPVERSSRVPTFAGAVLTATGAILLAWLGLTRRMDSFGIGLAVAMSGLALLIRPAVPAIARAVLGPVARGSGRRFGVSRLAADAVLRAPRRTAFTVGAVVFALAIVVAVSLATESFSRAFRVRFDEILAADLYVRSATWRPLGSDVPLDAALADEIAAVPGVEFTYPFRITTGGLRGKAAAFIAFDLRSASKLRRLTPVTRREFEREAALLDAPDAVLVSPSAVRELGYVAGSTVELPAPRGLERMRVVGTFPDPAALSPTIYFNFATFRALFGSDAADYFPVQLRPDADVAAVRAGITDRLAARTGVVVDTREQYVSRVNGVVGSFLSVVSSLLVLVVVTAGLGLANTLLISTLQRRRDLGVLRAVGMRRRQVRTLVVVEALVVGGIGAAFACLLGTALGYLITVGAQAQLGIPVSFVLSPVIFARSAALGVLGSAIAAAYPAWRASRLDVVDALRYE